MVRVTSFTLLLFFPLAFGVLTLEAHGGQQWYLCSIVKLGQSGGRDYIQLTHVPSQGSPAFTAKFFKLPAEKAREMLAVALAAVAGGFHVEVYVDAQIEYSEIYAMYLVAE